MLWLALHCPTLPLDCILRRWPEGLDPALAVTDLDGSRRLIRVATAKAQTSGVVAGQSVATALALLPDLILIARKVEDERIAVTEAALAALRFTPLVSLRASGLVMEISASLRLFGGRRLLKHSLAEAMRVQGLSIASAQGPTPHGAWLLALEHARRRAKAEMLRARDPSRVAPVSRPGQDFATALDALPIGHLESVQSSLGRLEGIGIRTFADLRRLPVKGLARRFGPALIDELARASGDRPDPQTLFEAPSRFDTRIELMARVESAEALVFASRRLLEQMTGWLAARRAAVRSFTLVLHHDRWTRDAIPPTPVEIVLATPGNDLTRLATLVREHLSRLELPAPVLELSLEAPAIVEECEAHGSLFPERERATETLARLLEKLTARLGREATTRLERVADHRPERAWREVGGDLLEERVAVASARSSRTTAATTIRPASNTIDGGQPGRSCGPRPVWQLPEPQPLEVRAERPVYEASPLDLVAGPERIETGWWDDAPATRDYFIGENAEGRLVWIYKERLPAPGKPLWYLQGLFG